LVAEEGHQRQHPFGHLRTVQHHAERAADGAEHLQHVVGDGLVLGGEVGFAGNGRDAGHGSAPFLRRFIIPSAARSGNPFAAPALSSPEHRST
jgi:hypothetical protein